MKEKWPTLARVGEEEEPTRTNDDSEKRKMNEMYGESSEQPNVNMLLTR